MLSNTRNAKILDGRFALPLEALSVGGHARLYKAYDLEESVQVAVKVFDPPVEVDERTLQLAWTNELDLYIRMGKHPNLLNLVAYGTPHDGTPWIAVEWCGEDLEAHVMKAPNDWAHFEPIAIEILVGLSALHSRGFIHRDIKPKNVLLADDRVKIADFGTVRLREVTSFGRTMRQLGTPPFAPPEMGTLSPTTAYDVYSFAVLVIACVSGDFEMSGTTPDVVLTSITVPLEVRDLLARCLSEQPEDRPGSASVLLAELRQHNRATEPADTFVEVGLEITAGALDAYQNASATETADLGDLIREFGTRPRIAVDPKEQAGKDILILGRSVVAVATAHSTRQGYLVVKHVWKPWVAQLQRLRKHSVPFKVRFRTALVATKDAAAFIETLPRDLQKFAADSKVGRANRSELHDRWERVLDAKIELARDRHSDIDYTSFRVEGSRVFLSVGLDQVDTGLDQLRAIRTTSGRHVRGEIESIEGGELVLYVSEGAVADIPRRGILSIDSERTLSKLNREQAALRRVFEGGAARSDLKDILNRPSMNPEPVRTAIVELHQKDLDDAKKAALSIVLGASGLCMVQGPPGTGKTTLIAEIVAQELSRKPNSRILLAAQTHIALDHALMKVTAVVPEASVLRIGNPDQFGHDIEPWSVPAQLAAWREETRIAGAEFVRRHLEATAPGNVNSRVLATRYEALLTRLSKTTDSRDELRRQLIDLTNRKIAIVSQVDALIGAIGDVDKHAPSEITEISAAVQSLVDGALNLSEHLMEEDGPLRRLAGLTVEVAELEATEVALASEIADVEPRLREEFNLAEDGVDGNLRTRLDEILSSEDGRAQAFQTLAEEWLERFRLSPEFRLALLFRAQLVASTCVALTGSQGADRVAFDLCIVDEASKATPTELMVPLASSMRWTLVGDEKQLPPFVETELRRPELLERFDLTRSDVEERLFAELVGSLPPASVLSLTQQHRMHPFIGNLVSDIFYDGRLSSSSRASSPVMTKQFGANAVWHDVLRRNSERRVGTSYDNREEAREIVTLLKSLEFYAANLSSPTIEVAILTGYLAQVRTLQELVSSVRSSLSHLQVRVATIDSFQGQEADICIVSVTRSNHKKEVGFLSSPERLNVAISRARDGLIVVGDRAMALSAGRKAVHLTRIAQRLAVSTEHKK